MAEDYRSPNVFHSPGAAAVRGIEGFLQQRAEAELRQREFELQQRQQEAAERQQKAAMELQARQMAIMEENQRIAKQKAIDDEANDAAATLLPTVSAGEELDSGVSSILGASKKYRGLIQQHQTLPSRGMAGTLPGPQALTPGVIAGQNLEPSDPTNAPAPEVPGVLAPRADTGGRSYATLRPSKTDQKALATQAAMANIGEMLKDGMSRPQIVAAMLASGIDVPTELWKEDPAVEAARQQANELIRIKARGAEDQTTARIRAANSGGGSNDGIDYEAIADGIEAGIFAPDVNMRTRYGMRLGGILARRKYDLNTANQDWLATKRFFQTLNGTQQVRVRQSANTAYESLATIEDLTKKWKGGRFPVLNKLNLDAAAAGVYGKEEAKVAQALKTQIADLTSELAVVYMGGNSPTDEGLKLAAENLKANWDQDVLLSQVELARTNLRYRLNSVQHMDALTPSSVANPNPQNPPPPGVPNPTNPVDSGGEWIKRPDGTEIRIKKTGP